MTKKRFEWIQDSLEKIESEMHTIRQGKIQKNNLFKNIVRAAYIKSYEFSYHVSKSETSNGSYFEMATLRGICEDLIAIKYLLTHPPKVRNQKAIFLTNYNLQLSLIKQYRYFEKSNPGQIIVNPNGLMSEERMRFVDNKPYSYQKALKQGYDTIPSTYKMAKETSYLDLYNYIYYSTSSLVHFSPDVLLKMGWGEPNDKKQCKNLGFSTNNFSEYYRAVNNIWGLILLVEQTKVVKRYLRLNKNITSEIRIIGKHLNEIDWPEMVTFEHLNISPPSSIIRLLHRVATAGKF